MTANVPAICLCVLAGFSAIALRVQQTPAPPVFKTAVDLLTAEASVFDKDGRPVSDLQPSDFIARVDGQSRAVVVARFFGSHRDASATANSPLSSSRFVSNADAKSSRVVVLALDLDSIRSGEEKP